LFDKLNACKSQFRIHPPYNINAQAVGGNSQAKAGGFNISTGRSVVIIETSCKNLLKPTKYKIAVNCKKIYIIFCFFGKAILQNDSIYLSKT